MGEGKYKRYILQLLLVVIVSFSSSSISAQTLKQRLNQQTDFTPQNSSPSEQLIEVAQRFKLPMAIEWLEQKEEQPKPKLAFQGGSVLDLIEAIVRESPGQQLLVKDRILYVYPPAVVSHPFNFLNLQVPNYDVTNTSLFAAQANLRTMINIMLYPDEYKYGHNGGYGGGYPGVFWKENITFAGRDRTIREILTGITEKSGNALWIVRLKSDELIGDKPNGLECQEISPVIRR